MNYSKLLLVGDARDITRKYVVGQRWGETKSKRHECENKKASSTYDGRKYGGTDVFEGEESRGVGSRGRLLGANQKGALA